MSTLVRITIATNIKDLVDLQPGESEWSESVFVVQPDSAFDTPDKLEEYAVACAGPPGRFVAMYTAGDDRIREPEPWMNDHAEEIVMAHFSEDL